MKTKLRIGLPAAGLFALLFVLSGCDKKTDATAAPAPPPEVGVVEVQAQPVQLTTELSGRTSAHLIAEVRPQVSGIIQQRLFTEGSDVKAGAVLYRIDPATYQAAYDSAKAALSKAEANLMPYRLKEERYRDLVKINAVSQQDYDDVIASLGQAEADIEGAKAAVQSARINLDYTCVKAPISGRIGRSAVTTGALVTASQADPLATIQQLDPVYVDVTQSTSELLRLKRNLASGLVTNAESQQAAVKLILEDGTPYPHSGTMKFSEVTVNQSTGSVTLRTLFPNPDLLLLPGMFVSAVVEEGVNELGIMVPQRGVSRDTSGNATALVVGADDKVEPRTLKVARAIGDQWLVSEGLQPGDRLIVEGLQRARPGTTVKPVPFNEGSGMVAVAPRAAVAKK